MKFIRHIVSLAALAGNAIAMPALALEIGQSAPELTATGPAGPVSLAALKGKVVYLDFWASWCGPCRQSFPWMAEMQSRYRAKGLHVLAVNLDAKREDADKFLAQTPAAFAVAFDPRGVSARAYALKGMPSSVLIGADGKVLAVHAGFRDDERQSLEDSITAALTRK
jgi:cytochrome c biogenesis protein CcmG, thiol:disulfide interchange protein DsbE